MKQQELKIGTVGIEQMREHAMYELSGQYLLNKMTELKEKSKRVKDIVIIIDSYSAAIEVLDKHLISVHKEAKR